MSGSKNINWSPIDYKNASVLAREVGDEIFSRLEWITLQPKVVLDAGCGTGELSARLQKHYPQAQIIALDSAKQMIEYAKAQTSQISCMCADAGKLPLQDQSVDMIFANFLFSWHEDVKALLSEWRRVLRPDGLLIFTALGPDTFKEWRHVLDQDAIPVLADMHDIGDLMVELGFSDPVLDVDHYTMVYREQEQMLNELHATGMLLSHPEKINVNEMPPVEDGTWPVTFEIVFTHAFIPAESDELSASSDGIVRVPLSHLRKQLRSR
jgi:malonyl-CoA O-methyltransferase